MNIISVDNERIAVDYMKRLPLKVESDAVFNGFTEVQETLDYIAKNKVDIALLDIEMGEISGIELAKMCKEIAPYINIIFVTGHSKYSMDALKLHASGYLLKPVLEDDLQTELKNLRFSIPHKSEHRVRIQTFGNFAVFVDDRLLYISQAKCRECLAYLIDRKGAPVTTAELVAVLWEDRPYDKAVKNYAHRVTSDLMKLLRSHGILDIIIKTNREIAINIDKVDCDYFEFLKGNVSRINTFHGEYMTNYSWAEFTVAELIRTKNS